MYRKAYRIAIKGLMPQGGTFATRSAAEREVRFLEKFIRLYADIVAPGTEYEIVEVEMN